MMEKLLFKNYSHSIFGDSNIQDLGYLWGEKFSGWFIKYEKIDKKESIFIENENLDLNFYKLTIEFNLPSSDVSWMSQKRQEIYKDSVTDIAREIKLFRFNFGKKYSLKTVDGSYVIDDDILFKFGDLNLEEAQKNVLTFHAYRIPNYFGELFEISNESLEKLYSKKDEIQWEKFGSIIENMEKDLKKRLEDLLFLFWEKLCVEKPYFEYLSKLFKNEKNIADLVEFDFFVFQQGIS